MCISLLAVCSERYCFLFAFYRLCGKYLPSKRLSFLSSGNVMLVTMATHDQSFPGFRAQVSQVQTGNRGRS